MHHIGGAWVPPASGSSLRETDPRSGEPSFSIARGSAPDVAHAVAVAQTAQPAWAGRRALERGAVLLAIARGLRAEAASLADIDQVETGRPRPQCLNDVEVSAQYFEFYGGLAPSIEGQTLDLGAGRHCYTRREPYGTVAVILPWNAPLNQAARAVAPALAAGNAMVVKPSEFTSVSALRLAEVALAAGLPAGLVNVVTGTADEVGEPLVAHPGIAKVAFTGSLRAGRAIGRVAADRVIPVTLELGGKSPDLVFADADLPAAARGAVRGFTVNAGQACIAGSRLLVQRQVMNDFSELVRDELTRLSTGAADHDHIGPIITPAQYVRVCGFLDEARREGATVLGGGQPLPGPGHFVPPTAYVGLPPQSPLLQEEIFGPIGVLVPFDDEAQAVTMANDTPFGLAAGVWTRDLARAHRVAYQLQAGQVYVNEYPGGGIETPFGGYKASGIGREKGREALYHYTQLKTVIMKLE